MAQGAVSHLHLKVRRKQMLPGRIIAAHSSGHQVIKGMGSRDSPTHTQEDHNTMIVLRVDTAPLNLFAQYIMMLLLLFVFVRPLAGTRPPTFTVFDFDQHPAQLTASGHTSRELDALLVHLHLLNNVHSSAKFVAAKGVFQTTRPVYSRYYHFYMRGQQLVVNEIERQASTSAQLHLELLDTGSDGACQPWGDQLPARLRLMHSHWLNSIEGKRRKGKDTSYNQLLALKMDA
eukprot:scaffold171662_cov22-Tisochrysis_lutea.AAC.1